MKLNTHMKEYKIAASRIPSNQHPCPQVYNATVYAINPVSAKSKLTKILTKQFKIKSTKTLIINLEKIEEENKNMTIKNYGISYVFKSKGKLINMYKEFRGLSRCDAVSMLYHDMAGRHNAHKDNVMIVEVKEVEIEELKRSNVIQFTGEVRFPCFRKKSNRRETFVSEKVRFYD